MSASVDRWAWCARESDEALVARVQRGEREAFDALVERYGQRALSVAWRLLGNAADAEDLVQDAFIRALDRIATFDTTRAFGPWFFRLLTNLGMNRRKARTLRATVGEPPDVAAHDAGPDVLAEHGDLRERFAAALAALPARQRLVVSMHAVDDRPTAEIALALGIAPETVRWHLHHARRELRKQLTAIR